MNLLSSLISSIAISSSPPHSKRKELPPTPPAIAPAITSLDDNSSSRKQPSSRRKAVQWDCNSGTVQKNGNNTGLSSSSSPPQYKIVPSSHQRNQHKFSMIEYGVEPKFLCEVELKRDEHSVHMGII